MGICCSCDSTSVATAKLILEDGRLQEYPYPIKASFVLQKSPSYFICNSDEMGFDAVLSAVGDDEKMQLGQLYFALPLSHLNRRLRAEDMAALAVKASTALGTKIGGNVIVFPGNNGVKQPRIVGEKEPPRQMTDCGADRRRKFTARLSAVAEE